MREQVEKEQDFHREVLVYSELEQFLEMWNNPLRKCHLELSHEITRPMIHRLLPLLLNHEGPASSSLLRSDNHNDKDNENEINTDHDVHSPDANRNDTPALQFASFKFSRNISFAQSDVTMFGCTYNYVSASDHCTPDDKHSFLSALAQYPLIFDNVPKMLFDFLNICEIDRFQSPSLYILERGYLSASDYGKLGDMIQRNVQLTELTLRLHHISASAPCAFYDGLAKSIHIQKLQIGTRYRWNAEEILPKLIAGNDGNGVVERLLRNPQSQLVELDISKTRLEDHHLIALVQSLFTSKVKELNFSSNNIRSRGLLEFIRQIPKMKSLQKISFAYNPWEKDSDLEECGAALLHGLRVNTSITFVNRLCAFPQYELLWRLLGVNFIRQKLFLFLPQSGEESPIPMGLWPLILANTQLADAVYFVLQNCPAIFSCCKG